jgi:hypothetical protein
LLSNNLQTDYMVSRLYMKKIYIMVSEQSGTYRWTSDGNLDNSGGIWPLNELLFMWLDRNWKSISIRITITRFVQYETKSYFTYKCLVLFRLANDLGMGPDIWFWSIWILSKLGRKPIDSGKGPVSRFPFTSLQM